MEKHKLFKRGSTSYRILLLTVAFVLLSVSILTPVFLVEGGNRTFGMILAIVLGCAYILTLIYFLYGWMKDQSSKDRENK